MNLEMETMLLVSGLYLLVIAVLWGLGLKGDLPKFVAVMRSSVPVGMILGLIDLTVLALALERSLLLQIFIRER